MEAALPAPAILALGFMLGGGFGALSSRTHFCTMGAVADIVAFGDWSRMRMWLAAIATAMLGTALLQAAGLFDPAHSLYAGARVPWLSHAVGGLCFGAGMTLASGCAGKTLVRLGGGSLKALVVATFLAIGASMTLRGLFAAWRSSWLDPHVLVLDHAQTLPAFLAAADLPSGALVGLVAGLALLIASLAPAGARRADILWSGAGVGLLCVAAWYVTGHLGYVAEDPQTLEESFIATSSGRAESLSFVAPHAYTLDLLLLWTDRSRVLSFSVATLGGVIAGALLYRLATRSLRLESFADPADLLRHVAGGLLMGFGGVTALGCSIGQGVGGLSTLSLGALITTAAIIAGATATLRLQLWHLQRS
ncbi:hypothetical protein dqs_0423 [Azoarcus olearius]|uniref:YeeE/YedE family protein n=1 Tax=Azoarcus sp. (strain BH72) TaxID=418699 RepID=UPI0008062509|nr:YeeE/YedE family protein [Azoarcus olearius]ANQ83499.1 hypothetical protein dqs_0423 [Azoarcus olearius]